MSSPYEGVDLELWSTKTQELIERHPLDLDTIRDTAIKCWGTLWQTNVGAGETAIPLSSIEVPATVTGYFFEKLFARELERKYPNLWKGGRSKSEKDFVCLSNNSFSIEMKSSGQLGTKIFGNRSYGQQTLDGSQIAKEEKSGYYITVNFYRQTLTLLRFGWIDFEDWKPQGSQTGQAATLPSHVYELKLIEISGAYKLAAPVGVLSGVGPGKVASFANEGIETVGHLLKYRGSNTTVTKFRSVAKEYLGDL